MSFILSASEMNWFPGATAKGVFRFWFLWLVTSTTSCETESTWLVETLVDSEGFRLVETEGLRLVAGSFTFGEALGC